MADRPFDFDIYRIDKVDEDGLLLYMGRPILNDQDIIKIIREAASNPECDVMTDREKSATTYRWGLRDFVLIDNDGISVSQICRVAMGRSVVQQTGLIMTDEGFEIGTSTPDRGLGVPINLIFYMERHISAIEYKGSLMGNQAWRTALHEILDRACKKLEFTSTLRLEPVARNAEILATVNSFSLLTRLRLKLLVPNPDLTREMKNLTDEMKEGGVRKWLQDMKTKRA